VSSVGADLVWSKRSGLSSRPRKGADAHEPQDLILGGGLTGLSCAYHLTEDSTVYERLPEIGGLARSEETNGFIFDYAPHILYTIDPYASKLIHELLKGNIHIKQRRAFIYHGKYNLYTQFPFQAHLYGLPGDVVGDWSYPGLVEGELLHRRLVQPAAPTFRAR